MTCPPKMMSLESTNTCYFFASGVATAVTCLILVWYVWPRRRPLPPGPKGLPVIGNLLEFNPKYPWKRFDEWHRAYGPIVKISALGQNIMILNTVEVATDLLEKRSHIYSDRPRAIVASIFTGSYLLPIIPWGDNWRQMRKAGHDALHGKMGEFLGHAQYRGAVLFPLKVLAAGTHWRAETERTPVSILLSAVYDMSLDDAAQINTTTEIMAKFARRIIHALSPGAYWVEYFTWMEHLPRSVAKWKRDAQDSYERDSRTFEGYLSSVEKRLSEGEDRPSVARCILRDPRAFSKRRSAWLLASIIGAATDTTGGSLLWFILAMIRYPDVQKKCQEELDRVIGRDRMPRPSDRRALPYMHATLVELLRWEFIGPIGVPHRSIADDWYNGYFIPKGTSLFPNITAMNREPRFYGQDGDAFNPSRFLNAKGEFSIQPGMRSGHVSFGFGQRICFGRLFANDTLFITLACTLWALNILPPRDADGTPILPEPENIIAQGIVIRPATFDAVFEPRFPEVRAIMQQTSDTLM